MWRNILEKVGLSYFLSFIFISKMSFAQDISLYEFTNTTLNFINNPPSEIAFIIPIILDVLIRMVKTKKPTGVLHVTAGGVEKFAQIIHQFAKMINSLAKVTDQFLPNHTIDREEKRETKKIDLIDIPNETLELKSIETKAI